MFAAIAAVEYYLPESFLTNDQLAMQFPEWESSKIYEKTGIMKRHIAEESECASDLGYSAAQKLFSSGACHPQDIDFLLLCTQSPDYFLPATACTLQDRLKLPLHAGALDISQGCSGYVYGLSLAKGLIESEQAGQILLITAETYSKFIDKQDKASLALFGDAASATLISNKFPKTKTGMDFFTFGTDGSGANNLIVESGAMRKRESNPTLLMKGSEIFSFALEMIPRLVKDTLSKAKLGLNDLDMYIFHQANRYILDHLKRKLGIPDDKFYISLEETGNTVSSSIPIALKHAFTEKLIKPGSKVMLVGFGAGYSWGASIITLENT